MDKHWAALRGVVLRRVRREGGIVGNRGFRDIARKPTETPSLAQSLNQQPE